MSKKILLGSFLVLQALVAIVAVAWGVSQYGVEKMFWVGSVMAFTAALEIKWKVFSQLVELECGLWYEFRGREK